MFFEENNANQDERQYNNFISNKDKERNMENIPVLMINNTEYYESSVGEDCHGTD